MEMNKRRGALSAKKLRLALPARALGSVLAMILFAAGFAGCGHTASAASVPETTPDPQALTEAASEIVDTLDLRGHALMALSDPGYGATQGMCVAENRYIIVGRYRTDGAKDLMVYDVLERRVKASNVFVKSDPEAPDTGTNVDLDHINGMCYENGYLYIPRNKTRDIIRLKMNEDCSIVFDSIAFSAPEGKPTANNVAWHDGVFYWVGSGRSNGRFFIYRSEDGFADTKVAFKSDFGGLAADNLLAKQGMCFDGEHLFFAFSGRLTVPPLGNGTDWQKLVRNTEKIVITKPDGEIVKTLTFSRGSYGEIEDVDTIRLGGSTYLIISCNRNDNNVACVYAVPLYRDTVPAGSLEAVNIDGSFYHDKHELEVYCDTTVCNPDGKYDLLSANPFATGMVQDPFTSVYAAVDMIKRAGCPARLYLTGDYGKLAFYNLPAGIGFVLKDAEVASLSFTQCPGITLEGQNKAVLGGLTAEKSVILAAPGISLVRKENGPAYAIEANASVLTGSFSGASGFASPLRAQDSLVSVSGCGAEPGTAAVAADQTSVIQLSYYNQEVTAALAKRDKNVMLSLTLRHADLGESNSAAYPGLLSGEYLPAADVVFPAVIADSETGAGPTGMCSVHIAPDGTITVYGGTEPIKPDSYILCTAVFLTA